jgi:hypothetical protein
MQMGRYLLTFLAAAFLAMVPLTAQAQGDEEGLILRIDGDITNLPGETVGTVIVISGDALVEGTITDSLVVVDGTATIRGTVEGDITVISGDLVLESDSRVETVNLIRSDLERASGATVNGDIHERENLFFRGAWAVFTALAWVGLTVGVILAGLVFAAVGGRQLTTAARNLTEEVANSILAAVILWIGLPLAAGLIMLTLIGIPFGLGMLLVVLPALFLLGYITTGTLLGGAITGFFRKEQPGDHPYLAVFLGLLILQLVLIIPVLGWLVVMVAGLWGSGGLALVAYRAARGRTATPPGVPRERVGQPS